MMAAAHKPYFQNDMGAHRIEIGATEFMCIGAKPPFDHPHVFLNIGMVGDSGGEVVCPYCSTHYIYNAHLKPDQAEPAAARWLHIESVV